MLDKKPATIGGMFDGIAATYDRLNRILSFSTDQVWRRAAVRFLDVRDGHRVLDIATGTGDLALLALSKARCSVVGIDLSGAMLSIAAPKMHQSGFADRTLFIRGDALRLPFRDCVFDRAMVAFGIRNMSGVGDFLDEVFRVLTEGGKIAILEFSLPSNPLLRHLYMVYFSKLLPLIGGHMSGNSKAYRYLCDSVLGFSSPDTLKKLMQHHGYRINHSQQLFLGIAHLFILQKYSIATHLTPP